MNFWSTSESESDVTEMFFSNAERRGAIKKLEEAINRHLEPVATGEWTKWCVIYIIVDLEKDINAGFRETRRLTRKDLTLDFRVFVDHKKAVDADFNTCVDLLVPTLERTLPYFSKAKIGKDVQEEIRRIIHLAANEVKASASSKH